MGLTPITQGGIWKLRGTLAAESLQSIVWRLSRATGYAGDAIYFGTQGDEPERPINTAKRGEEVIGGEDLFQGSSEKAAAPDGVKY